MKARFGGLLAMALGVVLIVNGVSSASTGTAGVNPLPPDACGTLRFAAIGIPGVSDCPTGSIVITETSTGSATPPTGGWQVMVTSSCSDPTSSGTVNRSVTVADGQSVTVSDLYIFQTFQATTDSAKCQYALAETAVPGVTASFTPASPVTIAYADDQAGRTVAVALANTAAAPSSTPASSTPPASQSVQPSETGSGPTTDFTDPASASAGAGEVDASGSASAAPIAETGPSQPITASLWLGIGLLFLGLFLLFEGRIRKLGKHRP